MKFSITLFNRFRSMAFLGIEMVLPGLPRQELPTLGDLKPLGIGLVGFHRHNSSLYY